MLLDSCTADTATNSKCWKPDDLSIYVSVNDINRYSVYEDAYRERDYIGHPSAFCGKTAFYMSSIGNWHVDYC